MTCDQMDTTTQTQPRASSSSSSSSCPHVLIFPLPQQGHVNVMLKLAELLALSGHLKLTFLNSEHNHRLLLRHSDIESRFSKYSDFDFQTVPDGLPENHPRSGDFKEIFGALETTTKQSLRDLLAEIQPPVDCIIGDGILGFVFDVASEFNIPMITFRTISASALWVYYNIPEMVLAGELPVKEGDMELLVTSVPGMEDFLRRRDLPSLCRATNALAQFLPDFAQVTRRCSEARGLILNTFEDLEGPTLFQIRTKCPKIYTLGPLHAHLETRLINTTMDSSNSLLDVDRSCLLWLDKQPTESVVYVSFGSITTLSREQLMEFWVGLVNSKKRFLWVIRPNLLAQDGEELEKCVPREILEGTKERGCMVGWAPQEEVLAHRAVGGFLTHSGWNSTLESLVEGIPMICWSFFADQQVNSRFVSEVWKLGMDMKDSCDKRIVEKMVNDLMAEKRGEFMESAAKMARLAKESVCVGGSSYCNLEQLIMDIRLMTKF